MVFYIETITGKKVIVKELLPNQDGDVIFLEGTIGIYRIWSDNGTSTEKTNFYLLFGDFDTTSYISGVDVSEDDIDTVDDEVQYIMNVTKTEINNYVNTKKQFMADISLPLALVSYYETIFRTLHS